MEKRKNGLSVVEDGSSFGLYVWKLPNGQLFMDDDGNTLNIPSMKYDLEKIKIITEAARYWGQPDGEAVFLGGVGRETDSGLREDTERMANGLTPYGDLGNWKELFANERKNR